MQHTDVVIIGGGLAGLYAATQLDKQNISYQLFDARHYLGGRIASVPNSISPNHFHDLGATWVFPHHTRMQSLVAKNDLMLHEQYVKGDVLYQFENIKVPRKISSADKTQMYRIEGGTYALIRALVEKLNPQRLKTDHKVIGIRRVGTKWQLKIQHKAGELSLNASNIMFAIPPRVIARDFAEAPFMTPFLSKQLMGSQTWMSAQAKLVVTYKTPFWRELNMSGQAFSQVGPLVEIHDACSNDTHGFGLFGLIGLAATRRLAESPKLLKQNCIKQLAGIFGHQAYRFDKCYLKDWATEHEICTGQDQSEASRHPSINITEFESKLSELGIFFSGSEFAKKEAGYLEGALHATDAALRLIALARAEPL